MNATAIRHRLRVLIVPEGQPIPAGAVVYGPARAEIIERLYPPEELRLVDD